MIQELLRHATLKVTMDTYVQAVSDEKRNAQTKVVKMLLPGIRRAVDLAYWTVLDAQQTYTVR